MAERFGVCLHSVMEPFCGNNHCMGYGRALAEDRPLLRPAQGFERPGDVVPFVQVVKLNEPESIVRDSDQTLLLPTDRQARKDTPVVTGVLDYFPLALAEVARVSKAGNDQHNPGQPLHWAREKSTDHADCIGRHLLERGTVDTDGMRHSAKLAWRALALLQTELEAAVSK